MARSLSSAVQVSVNNSIQLSSMPRFGIPLLVSGVSPLKLSKLDCTSHSTAILLPDATMLVGGGGRPGPVVNENVEIYSPPYLFQPNGVRAIRPVITSLSTKQPAYGGTIRVKVSDAAKIGLVSLIRLGYVTHSFKQHGRA
mmetsp:Transcript_28966/g.52416  ORF Transcript_28966/g.52416 Transcript_28966/m.52416 type:complete len:141 (+) Transcript_28966:1028-1450(+)